jgi:hypothetical protein
VRVCALERERERAGGAATLGLPDPHRTWGRLPARREGGCGCRVRRATEGVNTEGGAMLQVGEEVPEFRVASTSGELSAASLRGRPFVIYFFPKAFTGG